MLPIKLKLLKYFYVSSSEPLQLVTGKYTIPRLKLNLSDNILGPGLKQISFQDIFNSEMSLIFNTKCIIYLYIYFFIDFLSESANFISTNHIPY